MRDVLQAFTDPVAPLDTSALRRLAKARAPRFALAWTIRRAMPQGCRYFNVGHTNLTDRHLTALKDCTITILLHDTIPLDLPDLQKEGTPEIFEAKLSAAVKHADRLIYISEQTRTDVARHAADPVPPGLVAPIGVELADPAPDEIPSHLPLDGPVFVTLGTIEPRKNHAFLLDLWEALGDDGPTLLICGHRGWRNEDVFARLDTSPMMNRTVFECPGLSDGAVAALLERATAFLWPSRAEGYGLPPLEAAARGTPVLCAPLAVTQELLGDAAIYADLSDPDAWRAEIRRLARMKEADRPDPITPPDWDSHFALVLQEAGGSQTSDQV